MNSSANQRRARVLWSLIAEPTDQIAQHLRAVLGVEEALSLARTATAHDLLAATGGNLPVDSDTPGAGGSNVEERAERALKRWQARLESTDLAATTRTCVDHGIRVLAPGDDAWPAYLADLEEQEPVCLYARGSSERLPLLHAGPVALVGSRAASSYGTDTAASLALGVADRGRSVISGGAYGIDAAAHRGALGSGTGGTVAVLACGLDSVYPRGNSALFDQIAEHGVLLSESPPGTAPTRWRFLARNRLIAALSEATVVVEAAFRSGALNTARWADDLSRPVGAVPGPVTSPSSAGCHVLVRERGAVLVTDAAEVLELARGADPAPERTVQDELDLLTGTDRRVLDAVPPRSARDVSRLALDVGLDDASVLAAVGRLELLGHVQMTSSGVRRVRG